VNDTKGDFCTSCYTGVYPTDLVQLEVRESNTNARGKTGDPMNGNQSEDAAFARPVAVERES
jgi:hypothetical protein